MKEKKVNSYISTIVSIAEIILVLLPIYIGIWVSAYLKLEHITISGDIQVMGGWPQLLGLLVSLIILLVIIKRNNMVWADFGIKRPKNWITTVIIGLVISGIIFISVAFVINPTIKAMFPDITRDMSRFDYLYENIPNLIIQLISIWITAAFLEELLWRGFIIEKLLKYESKPNIYKILIVLLLSSILFGMAHLYQGPAGMIKTGAIGLVFGGCYFLFKRNLIPLMIAHGLIDTMDMISHYSGD